jgi:hypothetical protein
MKSYEGQAYLDLERTLWECEQKQGSSDVVTPEHEAALDAMEAYRNAKMKADR